MTPTTKKTLAVIGGIILIAAVSVLATLTLQIWHKENTPPPAPSLAAEIVPPAPAMAQVTAVKPHYIVTTKAVKQCHPVEHTEYTQSQRPPVAGAVIGGVAGGLVGSAVHGSKRDLAIGAGAVLGAATGAAVEKNRQQPQAHTTESLNCQTHNVTTKTQKGYEVTYLYNNQSSTSIMDSAPAVGSMLPWPVTEQSLSTPPPNAYP